MRKPRHLRGLQSLHSLTMVQCRAWANGLSLSPKMDFLKPEKTYSQLKQANTIYRLWRNLLNPLTSVHEEPPGNTHMQQRIEGREKKIPHKSLEWASLSAGPWLNFLSVHCSLNGNHIQLTTAPLELWKHSLPQPVSSGITRVIRAKGMWEIFWGQMLMKGWQSLVYSSWSTLCTKNKKLPFQMVDLTLFRGMILRGKKIGLKKGHKIYASNGLQQ